MELGLKKHNLKGGGQVGTAFKRKGLDKMRNVDQPSI